MLGTKIYHLFSFYKLMWPTFLTTGLDRKGEGKSSFNLAAAFKMQITVKKLVFFFCSFEKKAIEPPAKK
ncbi:hypothetical protein E2320_021940 [Naja naja]|nr:hypothetical protein E2320_021940 [Naja naja]